MLHTDEDVYQALKDDMARQYLVLKECTVDKVVH